MLRGEERVRGVRGRQRVGGQGVGWGHGMHGHGGGVGRVRDSLREDQVRVGVDPPAAGMEAVEERVHGTGVGIAERRRPDGILGAGGGQSRAVFGHQRLDGEAALGGGLEHPGGEAPSNLAFWRRRRSGSGTSPSPLPPRRRASGETIRAPSPPRSKG